VILVSRGGRKKGTFCIAGNSASFGPRRSSLAVEAVSFQPSAHRIAFRHSLKPRNVSHRTFLISREKNFAIRRRRPA
jgi:hypothetical protein